jgi:hypothetical protein
MASTARPIGFHIVRSCHLSRAGSVGYLCLHRGTVSKP